MHIHLDVIGGIAGDMFSAAMLDAFPELERPLNALLASMLLPVEAGFSLESAMDKGLTGKRFKVLLKGKAVQDSTHLILEPLQKHHAVLASQASQHQHHSWQDITRRLSQAALPQDIECCAKEIYTLLAQAECRVHNMSLQNIHLHEVGAIDAIIDIVSAAFLIHRSQATSWSISSLPWGGGTTQCEHGEIPLPAPATLALLDGFDWRDDGQPGERVTPTGAAILAWLKPRIKPIRGQSQKTGHGFGNRKLNRCANVLRVCMFHCDPATWAEETVTAIQCDIDDMTPELLAIAVMQLRAHDAVIDLTTQIVQGKKQRWVTRLEILCHQDHVTDVCAELFNQTSTLGVRFSPQTRYVLPRHKDVVEHNQQTWTVKYALRPNGETTCKVEADSLATTLSSHSQRQRIKAEIENDTDKQDQRIKSADQ